MRAFAGDPLVHRQRAEQRHQHQYQGCDRRKRPGGERGDAWLVSERREVIDASEAHHLPPGVGVSGLFANRGAFSWLVVSLH